MHGPPYTREYGVYKVTDQVFPELETEGPRLRDADAQAHVHGVLPSQDIRRLISEGAVHAAEPVEDRQVQPASLDLRLGKTAYRLQASFLPGSPSKVENKLASLSMARLDLSSPTVLERGCVYLVPLMEKLHLPEDIEAKANPKSTTGRLDVFTRLIADYGAEFERVPNGYSGPLYAEVMPRTFPVIVHPGQSLSQIRFIRTHSRLTTELTDRQTRELDKQRDLIYLDDEETPSEAGVRNGVELSVSLHGDSGRDVIAYRGRRNARLVDLSKVNEYDVNAFWDAIPACPDNRLILNPGDFYILVSRERVRVPPGFAAEMKPFDASVGEFRIHYAGFFDPGFGYGAKGEIKGTRAVLEVRAHEVPFVIEHGQVVGRLVYSHVRDVPKKIYGVSIGSSYQRQELALSKQFRRATYPLPHPDAARTDA